MGNGISVQLLVFCMLNNVRSTCAQLGNESKVYQQLFEVHFLSSFLPVTSSHFLLPGGSSISFQLESWDFSYPDLPCTSEICSHAQPNNGKTSKMKSSGDWAYPLGNTTPQLNVVESSSTQSVSYCGPPYATQLRRPWTGKKTRHGYNKRFPCSL